MAAEVEEEEVSTERPRYAYAAVLNGSWQVLAGHEGCVNYLRSALDRQECSGTVRYCAGHVRSRPRRVPEVSITYEMRWTDSSGQVLFGS